MKKRKLKTKSKLILILLLICIIIVLYFCFNTIIWKVNVSKNNKLKEEVNSYVTFDEKENLKNRYRVDFDALKKINPDVVAYIKVNGTDIEYPVVKANDNKYYLKHNFNKEYNKEGWIFADYKNNIDENDKNIIIYGSNKNGSMFNTLTNVLDSNWQEEVKNTIILLVLENDTYIYQVFSTYETKDKNNYLNTEFSNEEYSNFLKNIKDKSNYDYQIGVNDTNTILTLSSDISTSSKKVVLHAKRIY